MPRPLKGVTQYIAILTQNWVSNELLDVLSEEGWAETTEVIQETPLSTFIKLNLPDGSIRYYTIRVQEHK